MPSAPETDRASIGFRHGVSTGSGRVTAAPPHTSPRAECDRGGWSVVRGRWLSLPRSIRLTAWLALAVLAGWQAWRHGHDYVLLSQFAEIEPGRVYRGAWQKPWPMSRLLNDYDIKTVVALAHPADHPLAIREKAQVEAHGARWVHLPIVDDRRFMQGRDLFDQIDEAVKVVGDPANQPVFFHCHHGINRASMVQMAYRMKVCGWSFDEAVAEIDRTFGLVAASRGPDYRRMKRYYHERVLGEALPPLASQPHGPTP
ncbi:tyrosine phosphatase [Isosphaera pallida ATCC 43644]|uniref:Tyrosine phosphatase n=1 Tax=Isosphaera pallida (strain ATCC 43644 / DSM 9630 / IS1B) TaxID=575540 RepID=E8R4V3_ISOPI|nr:dual specificity protein phosphatase family protein [Isosphaera pallida]ADV61699.1 tyrosine phosphatase [Isosphaera pallida ATCC 43644]